MRWLVVVKYKALTTTIAVTDILKDLVPGHLKISSKAKFTEIDFIIEPGDK